MKEEKEKKIINDRIEIELMLYYFDDKLFTKIEHIKVNDKN